MRPTSPSRALRLTGAVAAACLLAGCAVAPDLAEDSASDDGVPLPATEGYQPLTVYLAVAEAEAVPGTSGRPFGCGDLLVPVQTVPTDTEDEADTALDFLFADERGWHGDPSLWNAVFDVRESLIPPWPPRPTPSSSTSRPPCRRSRRTRPASTSWTPSPAA